MDYLNIFILIFAITFIAVAVWFFASRKPGCLDINASNYNRNANLHVPNLCNYDYESEEVAYGKYIKNTLDTSVKDKLLNELEKNDKSQVGPSTGYGTYLVDPVVQAEENVTDLKTLELVEGCSKKWSSNYNKDYPELASDKKCLTPENIMDRTVVWSSGNRSVVNIDKKIILDNDKESISVVILDRSSGTLTIKLIQSFFTNESTEQIEMLICCINSADNNDLVIITTCGRPHELMFYNIHLLDKYIKSLNILGARNTSFTDDSKYILISSKKGDIFFEKHTEDSVSFPEFEIQSYTCRINPSNLYPPKDYFIFDEKVPTDETIYRCMFETSTRGLYKFGIVDNNCIPLEKTFKETSLPITNLCMNGIGAGPLVNIPKNITQPSSLAVYNIDKNEIQKVRFFNDIDYEGKVYTLPQGDHHPNFTFRSLSIPVNFYFYLVKNNKVVKALYGYIGIKNSLKEFRGIDYDMVSIRKHYPNSVVLCDDNICATFGPGKHVLSPHFFIKVKTVKLSSFTNKVTLYKDLQMFEEIGTYTNQGPTTQHQMVEIPRIVRSIQIL